MRNPVIYDVRAPKDAYDSSFIDLMREDVGLFDFSKPLLGQIAGLVKSRLASVSLQWSTRGLNVYPLAANGDMLGWAFHCRWAVLKEELYVFASGYTSGDESPYTEEGLKEIATLRDELQKLVKILDGEISKGKPSRQTLKRF